MRRELQPHLESPPNSWERALAQEGLVPVSPESKLGRALGPRLPKRLILHVGGVIALLLAACSSGGVGEKNNTQELENKISSGYELPFPPGETWYLTGGPHADGFSNGVRYAIDIAPPEGGFCPSDGRKFTIDNRVVTASASGEVIIKGDDKNRNDPHHSEIRIKDKNGLTQVYIHLDNTKVGVGDEVKLGDRLGNPSCEFPPGGANTGPHVHVGLMKDGQPVPINKVVVGGWTIHNGVNGKEGTMTKSGEDPRTANTGRYSNGNGIRNDLPNNPNRAVVAGPKPPTTPISGIIKEKPANPTSPTERQVDAGWTRVKSSDLPYQIDYPSSGWTRNGNVFYGEGNKNNLTYFQVTNGPVAEWITLEDLKNQFIEVMKNALRMLNKRVDSTEEFPDQHIAGQKAWRVDMRFIPLGAATPASQVTYLIIKDGMVWEIEFGADSSEFDQKLPTFQKMLSSFKFLK